MKQSTRRRQKGETIEGIPANQERRRPRMVGSMAAIVSMAIVSGLTAGCGREEDFRSEVADGVDDASRALRTSPAPFRDPRDLGELADFLRGMGGRGPLREALAAVRTPDAALRALGADLSGARLAEGLFLSAEGNRETSADGGRGLSAWRLASDGGPGATREWRLHHRGIPVEKAQLKEQDDAGVTVFAQGNIPSPAVAASTRPEREAFVLDASRARDTVAWRLNFHPWRVSDVRKVYVAAEEGYVPAWRAYVADGADSPGRGPAVPLSVLLDDRSGVILSQTPMSIHVDGSALLFDENSVVDGGAGRKETVLPSLVEPGSRLTHKLFAVYSCGELPVTTKCAQTARGNAGDFTAIGEDSPQYDELVAYHAVTKSMTWYRKIMALTPSPNKSWGGSYPGTRSNFGIADGLSLAVYVRAQAPAKRTHASDTGYTPDNAAYMPSSFERGSQVRIVIGTGWEEGQPLTTGDGRRRILRYLGRDTDVVMHEFGHHIVYRSLRDVSGQGGALHEGLADYFTYAMTGNRKLGESIVLQGESLRSGDKTGPVDPYVRQPAHIAGEYMSSVLWEIREELGPWKSGYHVFDKIVWEAIDLFKEDAVYYDVIAAIARSAEQFAKEEKRSAVALKEQIFKVFHARGFLEAPTGKGELPAATSAIGTTPIVRATSSGQALDGNDGSEDKPWYQCGVVAGVSASAGARGKGGAQGAGGGGTPLAFLALLALPLLAPLLSGLGGRRELLRAKAHRKK